MSQPYAGGAGGTVSIRKHTPLGSSATKHGTCGMRHATCDMRHARFDMRHTARTASTKSTACCAPSRRTRSSTSKARALFLRPLHFVLVYSQSIQTVMQPDAMQQCSQLYQCTSPQYWGRAPTCTAISGSNGPCMHGQV